MAKQNKRHSNTYTYTFDMNAFREFIDQLRLAKKMKVIDLAEVTGISIASLYRFREGHNLETSAVMCLMMWSGVDIKQFVHKSRWPTPIGTDDAPIVSES